MKKVLIALCWFPLTLSLLAINLSLLVSLSKKANAQEQMTQSVALRIAATSYGTEQVLGASVLAGDARTLLLTKFLTTHQSPLAEYADYILDRAQYYDIDYRLVPAIAMCESNAGKRMPTKDSFNAWGISVETGETSGAKFPNWLYAIDWVSRYLKEKYYARGITDLINIGAIYAPPSVANGNSWANCVGQFMDDIQ
ncbi:MAG: hypothetical protein AAB960_01770 [Patescibacteria group bacterium]